MLRLMGVTTGTHVLPVCCPLSFQGDEGILPEQRAGVDLSIRGEKLGELVVRCV